MENDFWEYLERLIEESTIVVDRPKGTAHPQFPEMIYPLDYGYFQDTTSMDGGGIDIWVGSQTKKNLDAIICTIDLNKKDIEIKLLIGCSEVNQKTIIDFHNSDAMRAFLIRRQ